MQLLQTGDTQYSYEAQKEAYQTQQMLMMFAAVALTLFHTYVSQKDMIIKVCEKHIVAQQQTQLRDYIVGGSCAISVVSMGKDAPEILLANSVAQWVYKTFSDEKIDPTTKLFAKVEPETLKTFEDSTGLETENECILYSLMDLSRIQCNCLQVFKAVYKRKNGVAPKDYLFQLAAATITFDNR